MLQNSDKFIYDRSLYTKFFISLGLNHRLNDLHINRDSHFGAGESVKIIHRLRMSISSYDDFNIFREIFWQPESNITFLIGSSINKVVDSLKYEDDFIEDFFNIFDDLSLNFLIADIQPVSEIISEFFLMKLNFLSNVEFLSKFDKNAIYGVVIIGVVTPSSGEV